MGCWVALGSAYHDYQQAAGEQKNLNRNQVGKVNVGGGCGGKQANTDKANARAVTLHEGLGFFIGLV